MEVSKVMEDVGQDVGVMAQKLRLEFLAAKPLRARYMTKGLLDGRRLHSLSTGSRDIFYRKLKRTALNTAVTLLIDSSGSMNTLATDSKRRIELAGDCAVLLALSMEQIGVSCEILSFTQKSGARRYIDGTCYSRSQPLIHMIHKRFDRKFRHSLDGLSQIGCEMQENADGESVLWAAGRLRKRPELRKILMVLSDGFPSNCDSVHDNLNRHLKEVVTTVTASGIEVIGIGIATSAVEKFYPVHVVVNNAGDLVRSAYGKICRCLRGQD